MKHKRKTSFSLSPLVGILAVLIFAGLFARTSWTYRVVEESIAQQIKHISLVGGREMDVLDRIAVCESGDRHFDAKGRVIRGVENHNDIGRFQISSIYWEKKAIELGYDIYDEKGNTLMANWIYEKYGSDPWKWSKSCWSKAL